MKALSRQKAYRGVAMEGFIADCYTKNTRRDFRRFEAVARDVAERVPPGSRVLEVAPGPGYLAIQLAKLGRYQVTGLDISRSFVRIAGENAARAGVEIDFRQGDAAHMPFPDASFDHVLCMPRSRTSVLKPARTASIYDLRKDASLQEIDEEVQGMNLSALNAALTKWTFRVMLLPRAYHRDAVEGMAAQSLFKTCEIVERGIGFEMRLKS